MKEFLSKLLNRASLIINAEDLIGASAVYPDQGINVAELKNKLQQGLLRSTL